MLGMVQKMRQSLSAIPLVLTWSHSIVGAFNSFSYWGPKQTPLALELVDVICGIVGSGGGGGM